MRSLRITLFLLSGCLALGVSSCGENATIPTTGTIYGDLMFEDSRPAAGIEVLVEGTDLRALSDAHGRFVIPGVLAVDEAGMGKYYVVRGHGERNGSPVGFLVDQFKVKGQQSYSVGEVVVFPTGSIFGYVELEQTGDYSGVRMSVEGTSLEAISRWDGSYLIDNVPAHDGYLINCVKEGYWNMVIQTMPGADGPVPIAVYPTETTQLETADLARIP